MKNCDCNQGRLTCSCDKSGTADRDIASSIILVAAVFVGAMYIVAKYLIGA